MTIADGLDALDTDAGARHTFRVDELYGGQPDVLDAIERAWRRGVPASKIARHLTAEAPDASISEAAVRAWCKRRFGDK